jgi:hypothetical protein
MQYERIIKTYNDLPENKRSPAEVARRLGQEGCRVRPDRISEVLASTVLPEIISDQDLTVTARTLQKLIDCAVPSPADFDHCEEGERFGMRVVKPLRSTGGPAAYEALDVIGQKLGLLIRAYVGGRELESYLDHLETMERLSRDGADLPF